MADAAESTASPGLSGRLLARMASSANAFKNTLDFGGGSGPVTIDAALKKMADQITEQIDAGEDDKGKSFMEMIRLTIIHYRDRTLVGHLYTQLMVLINTLACFQYIYLTYTSVDTNSNSALYYTFFYVELCVACLFVFDFILSMFSSDSIPRFLCSFHCAVDLMTFIPVFATYDVTCPDFREIGSGLAMVYFTLCGMTTARILRSLRFRKYFQAIDDEVQRFLADMGLKIGVMILFNAAVVQYLEQEQGLPFHTWMYYMLVTIATVGYGDVTPQTAMGRFAAMGMIIVAIISVPQMTNELMEMIARQSVYARASYEPKTQKSTHVLVCGDVTSSSLEEFFQELFHEDHDITNLYAVVLQPCAPTYEMQLILRDPVLCNTVTYLEGNALNEKDLKRAKASRAKAIFIMTNKFSADPDEEDAKTILQQFSIQRFLRLHSEDNTESLFCLQLIRPENKRHLVTSVDTASTDLVICLNEFKMGVIAKAVIFPGANTLIMNLLTSFADDKETGTARILDGIETLDDDEDSDWLGEYQRGCDWEIYTTELSSTFEGSTFCALSEILYQKLGIVLFALEVEDLRKEKSQTRLLLNPADFVIPPKSEFRIDAFVMAKNKAQSDLSFTKSNSESILGSGINFSHLSLLATGIAQRMTMNHGGTKVHIAGHDHSRDSPSHPGLNPGEKADVKEKQAWQKLLRKHEAEKLSESRQEEQQKLEDRILRENYYIRDVQTELADAMVKSSVSEEMPFVDNHIIIIGKALSNLYDLIRPLRSRNLGELKHIVIIYPGEFPPAVWQRISIFESIWVVRGSALEEADIRRAGIFKAKQVVVLADASAVTQSAHSQSSGSAAGLDALVDADAIFCYQCVRKMNEQAHVVVEIVRHTNVGYLDPESGLNSSDIDYKFTPQFASGALFATSLLDTLVCQAFYNTKIIDVINKLIGSVETIPKDVADKLRGTGNKSAGNSPTKAAATGGGPAGSNLASMVSSSLYQISIPDGLESRTYGSLYRLLSRRKQIPLGILRGVFSNTKSGPKANKMPYVFTNPPKDTELFTCDKVFVLSQTPVGLHRVLKDESREMQMYSNIRSRKKTTDDIVQMMGAMKEELRRLDVKSGNVDTRVSILSDDINARFDVLFRALNINPNAPPQPVNTPSPHLNRAKSMRPGSASEKLVGTKNMSIESFANFYKQESLPRQGSRPRLDSGDSGDQQQRPSSAQGGRPQLQRTRTSSNASTTSLPQRPVSGQRGRRGSGDSTGGGLKGRRGSGANADASSTGYGRTRDGREISRVGFF